MNCCVCGDYIETGYATMSNTLWNNDKDTPFANVYIELHDAGGNRAEHCLTCFQAKVILACAEVAERVGKDLGLQTHREELEDGDD